MKFKSLIFLIASLLIATLVANAYFKYSYFRELITITKLPQQVLVANMTG